MQIFVHETKEKCVKSVCDKCTFEVLPSMCANKKCLKLGSLIFSLMVLTQYINNINYIHLK